MFSFLLTALPLLYLIFFSRRMRATSLFIQLYFILSALTAFFCPPGLNSLICALFIILLALADRIRKNIIRADKVIFVLFFLSFIHFSPVIAAAVFVLSSFTLAAGRAVRANLGTAVFSLLFSLNICSMYFLSAFWVCALTLLFSAAGIFLDPFSKAEKTENGHTPVNKTEAKC